MAPPKHAPRTETVQFRCTPFEKSMLRDLAKMAGLSDSDVIRMMIRQAHRQATGNAAAPGEPLG